MKNNIEVIVILVNYHTELETKNIVEKYDSMHIIDEIIVVDNESTEKSRKILNDINSNKLKIINNQVNSGYSIGNNIAMKSVAPTQKKRFFIISNSDIDVDELVIQKIIEDLNANYRYGALAPLMFDKRGKPNYYRSIPLNYKRLFLRAFSFKIDKRNYDKLIVHSDGIIEQSYLPGSFFICTEEAMIACQYFDENVFLYREEEILALRMNRSGYLLGIDPSVKFIHNHQYHKESLSYHIKMIKQMNISEKYYFKEYFKANKLEMLYVDFMQKIFLLRYLIKVIVKTRDGS